MPNVEFRMTLGSAGCQPAVRGSLPRTDSSRIGRAGQRSVRFAQLHSASCRMRQAGSLRSPRDSETLRFWGSHAGRDEALGDIAGPTGGDHVELSGHAIHSGDGAVSANVHFIAHKWWRWILAQLAPTRAGEKRRHDQERTEHASANSFHSGELTVRSGRATSEMTTAWNATRCAGNFVSLGKSEFPTMSRVTQERNRYG